MTAPLSRLLVLTDRVAAMSSGHTLHAAVAAALDGGARTVVFREKDLSAAERIRLAWPIAESVHRMGAQLIVASDSGLAERVGAAGVHLASADPITAPTFGRSCHRAEDLSKAEQEGATYATMSPVFLTPSKPGYGPPLGVDGLRSLLCNVTLPVYALGGIDVESVAACNMAGAHGVAVMGAVMSAPDPAAVVRRYLQELS